MDPVWLLILLPVAAASGWLTARTSKFPWHRREKLPAVYLQGINFLLNEQHDKAIEIFLDMLEVDKETIEIHLALGNLFRRQGEVSRATRIHENLIIRSDLTADQKMQAIFELGQDYYVAGLFDRAEQFFSQLTNDKKYGESSYEYLRQVYEQEKEWDKCIKVTRSLIRYAPRQYSPILAQYYCEISESAIAEGRYDAAEEITEKAMTADHDCVRAILQSGRLKALRGDHRRAIAIWRTIEQKKPEFVAETVDLVAESFRLLNRYDELEEFLKTTAESATDAQLAIAYADALETNRGIDSAKHYLTSWVRRNPSLHSLHRLILLKLKEDDEDSRSNDFKLIEKMIRKVIDSQRQYNCQRCGFTVKTLHWQCPGCKSWNSILSANKVRPDKSILSLHDDI